jgi:hypothetical protein
MLYKVLLVCHDGIPKAISKAITVEKNKCALSNCRLGCLLCDIHRLMSMHVTIYKAISS